MLDFKNKEVFWFKSETLNTQLVKSKGLQRVQKATGFRYLY